MYEEYIKFPDVTKKRMFYEAMEDVLPDIKLIIQGNEGNMTTMLPLDSFVTENKSSISGTAGQTNTQSSTQTNTQTNNTDAGKED